MRFSPKCRHHPYQLFCDNPSDGQSTDRGISADHVSAGLASLGPRGREAIWSTHVRQRRVDRPIEAAH